MRLHLFELEDQAWFSSAIRDLGTDFLRFMSEQGRVFAPAVPRLVEALRQTGDTQVLDLGSGGGGPVLWVAERLGESDYPVTVLLTDKFPNLPASMVVCNTWPSRWT